MKSNEGQIDLLIRRFATGIPASSDGGDHLDADELSAFAEGALPAAARARYISHLAECDRCRRQAADLAIASGAVVRVAQGVPETRELKSLWATLLGSFSLPTLRYAAFAAVLLIVAGVAFVALRRRSEPVLIASREARQEQPVSAIKPSTHAGDVANGDENKTAKAPAVSQTPIPAPAGGLSTSDGLPKVDTAKAPVIAAPVEPKEIATAQPESMKKAEATITTVQNQPSYAPAPPGESQSLGRMGQSQSQIGVAPGQTGGAQVQGGGFKMQESNKSQAEDRERDAAKDARLDDAARQRSNDAALAQKRGADEKQKGGPSRNMDNVAANNRNSNEVLRTESPRKSDGDEEAPQTRSAGGRKFSRQGSRWVDQKFKSSMSLNNISRGSDEFAALDSGLRSIAQQLGGEVIVVWKGKAYLIK